MTIPFGLTPLEAAVMAMALLAAAWVRGYSGFGFAALVVSAAGLVTNPLHFVPVVLLADIGMTVQQVRGIWGEIDWRRVAGLFAGCLLGVPVGVWGLANVGIDMARAVIALFVLAMCAALLAGWRLSRPAGDGAHVATGVVSGVANGAAVGGLPVAVFFTAQGVPPAVFRATVIAYFTLLDLWSIPLMWQAGLVTRDTLVATVVAMPLLALGIWAGGRQFRRATPGDFRRVAILILTGLSVLGLMKSVL